MQGTKPGKAAGVDEVCPELLTADMEDTTSRLNSFVTTGFGKLTGGRKCGVRNLLSYLVVCVNATTGEE